ncbi:MAG TPA: ATP-binding protein [Rhodocyclaceae bacterium]|nr:ATP-binding protein [Rhodocyclaceae bacterium]
MSPQDVKELIRQGENVSVEFKEMPVRPEAVAREMVAFANSVGGVILLGVSDAGELCGVTSENAANRLEEWVMNIARSSVVPALTVGCDILKVDGVDVCAISIPKGNDKPYQTGDKYLIRVGSTNRVASQAELMRLFQVSGVFHYDSTPVAGALMNDLNMATLDAFFSSYGIEFSGEEEPARRALLCNTDILTDSGAPTVGGLLMFGLNPVRYLPQSGIMFAHFNGNETDDALIDRQEIGGTLPQQVDTALAVIKNNRLNPSVVDGLKRRATGSVLPDKVFREVIVNACVHRNYSIAGSRIRILMYDDRLEFISPGRLPNTVTVEKLRSGVSYSLNPVIVKFMDNLRYMDRLGRGFPMIYREMEKLGLSVSVRELGEELRVTLYWA